MQRNLSVLLILAMVASLQTGLSAEPRIGALTIPTGTAPGPVTGDVALSPADPVWTYAVPVEVGLHRTPSLYSGGLFDNGRKPRTTLRLLGLPDNRIALQLTWEDSTPHSSESLASLTDRGADHIYKTRTSAPERFPDAVCVMVPQRRGPHERYPSLMMGDPENPVDLYFWKEGRGFEHLTGSGRGTVAAAGADAPPGQVVVSPSGDGWQATWILPDIAPATPLAFAVWDGDDQQRDGLKYFSLWYEVGP